MCSPRGRAIIVVTLWSAALTEPAGAVQSPGMKQEISGMERTDWLDARMDPADARFLMLTAITHHRFSAPIWGQREVRKLQAELAEIEGLARRVVADHLGARPRRRQISIFGAPA
jgi:hypothetical protein